MKEELVASLITVQQLKGADLGFDPKKIHELGIQGIDFRASAAKAEKLLDRQSLSPSELEALAEFLFKAFWQIPGRFSLMKKYLSHPSVKTYSHEWSYLTALDNSDLTSKQRIELLTIMKNNIDSFLSETDIKTKSEFVESTLFLASVRPEVAPLAFEITQSFLRSTRFSVDPLRAVAIGLVDLAAYRYRANPSNLKKLPFEETLQLLETKLNDVQFPFTLDEAILERDLMRDVHDRIEQVRTLMRFL